MGLSNRLGNGGAARALPWLNHRNTLIDGLSACALLLSFLAFDIFVIPFGEQLGQLDAKSFRIYLGHAPVMECTAGPCITWSHGC